MHQSWLTHLAPTDLIAAGVDIALGVLAAAWLVLRTIRSTHGRGHDGPSE